MIYHDTYFGGTKFMEEQVVNDEYDNKPNLLVIYYVLKKISLNVI